MRAGLKDRVDSIVNEKLAKIYLREQQELARLLYLNSVKTSWKYRIEKEEDEIPKSLLGPLVYMWETRKYRGLISEDEAA
jgi:hypothetical protein